MKSKTFSIWVILILLTFKGLSQMAVFDTSFNKTGIVHTTIGKSRNLLQATFRQGDGKFMVVSNSEVGLDKSITFSRYHANGLLDKSFGKQGVSNFGPLPGNYSIFAFAAVLQPDGNIVVAGDVTEGTMFHSIILRFLPSGQLDFSFNTIGYRIIRMTSSSTINALAIQTDGKIVASGGIDSPVNHNIVAIRLTNSGNLDTGFGINGITTIDIGGTNGFCTGMIIASSGSIFICGYNLDDNFYRDFIVVKLNGTGKKDNSFNLDGVAITDIKNFDDIASGISIQSDGKILVTGSTEDGNQKLSFATVRYLSSGNLDSSFDQDGIAITQLGNISSEASDVKVQNDGKIIGIGTARMSDNIWNIAMVRYSASGVLDPTFSGDGKLTTNYFGTDQGRSVIILTDGSLVVWGQSGELANSGILLKYSKVGSLDPSFGTNGITFQELYQVHSFVNDLTIQTNGNIITGGTSNSNATLGMVTTRMKQNGLPDTTYNTDGIAQSFLYSANLECKSIALQADGKIVQLGIQKTKTKNDEIIIIRYHTDGSLDESFGTNGRVNTDVGNFDDDGVCMAVQADNKLIVAGYSYNGQNYDFLLTRYLPNGNLDNSFSADGKIIIAFGTGNDEAHAIALQKDGKILVGGFTEGANHETQFAVIRLTAQGNLDQTFNKTGKLSIDLSPDGNETIKAIKVQGDGKIILAGDAFNGMNNDFALVRILPDGSLDNTFSGDGILIIDINNNYNETADVELLMDGRIIAGGTCILNNTYEFALSRITPDGQLDAGFGDRGIAILSVGPEDDILSSLALQADEKLILGGSSYTNYRVDFTLARVLPKLNVGVLDQEDESNAVLLYPNPILSEITIEYELNKDEEINITLVDLSGKKVQQFIKNERKSQGYHKESLKLDLQIPDGFYLLNLSTTKRIATVKVYKKSE